MASYYHGKTPAERAKSGAATNKAIKDGVIPPAKELGCKCCGQKEGIIEYHNPTYQSPTEGLEPLCYLCHMVLHSMHFAQEACRDYFLRVGRGERFGPVYSRDFGQLKQFGIIKTFNKQ